MKWHLDSLIFRTKGVNLLKNHLGTFRTYSKQNGPSKENQKIFIMRHGERVDFIFHHWTHNSFDSNGKYIRKDLNMPESLPKRKLGIEGFVRDSPLTNIGILQAKLTGEALKHATTPIEFAYSSPSLRCIQTCHAVLTELGLANSIAIRLEPGLFECLFWNWEAPPDWLTAEEFMEAGYNIDASYVPIVTRDALSKNKETCELFYVRSNVVMTGILRECTTGNILLAGHAPTAEMCTRQLVGLKPRSGSAARKLFERIPYCSLIALENKEDKWEMVEPPCQPLTHSNNPRFNWKNVLA